MFVFMCSFMGFYYIFFFWGGGARILIVFIVFLIVGIFASVSHGFYYMTIIYAFWFILLHLYNLLITFTSLCAITKSLFTSGQD